MYERRLFSGARQPVPARDHPPFEVEDVERRRDRGPVRHLAALRLAPPRHSEARGHRDRRAARQPDFLFAEPLRPAGVPCGGGGAVRPEGGTRR